MKGVQKEITKISNWEIESVSEKNGYLHHIFDRVAGKEIVFKKVDFSFSTFEHCYFRSCKFDSCKFTGCKFISSNFEGSEFIGCNFSYSSFQYTNIDEDILLTNCPSYENLKLKFARTLRTNYQSIGNSDGVNKAIIIELKATKVYLYKAWNSSESYYRNKYRGWDRIFKFFGWLKFKAEEFIWGNGESIRKLGRAILIILLILTLVETRMNGDINVVDSYFNSALKSPQILMSIEQPKNYPKYYLSIIYFIRLLFFGLFMAIVIKRFSKR